MLHSEHRCGRVVALELDVVSSSIGAEPLIQLHLKFNGDVHGVQEFLYVVRASRVQRFGELCPGELTQRNAQQLRHAPMARKDGPHRLFTLQLPSDPVVPTRDATEEITRFVSAKHGCVIRELSVGEIPDEFLPNLGLERVHDETRLSKLSLRLLIPFHHVRNPSRVEIIKDRRSKLILYRPMFILQLFNLWNFRVRLKVARQLRRGLQQISRVSVLSTEREKLQLLHTAHKHR